MTLLLNGDCAQTGASPAVIELFSDAGSLAHLILGAIAGSEYLTPKDSLMLFAGFAGYQISQTESGEPWSRTGGELIEFGLGMLLMRLLPHLVPLLEGVNA